MTPLADRVLVYAAVPLLGGWRAQLERDGARIEDVASFPDLLSRSVDRRTRAVYCGFESPRDCSRLQRVRLVARGIPLTALVPPGNPALGELALACGVDRVISAAGAAAALQRPPPAPTRDEFRPLLIEDDPSHGRALRDAFRLAGVPGTPALARSIAEAEPWLRQPPTALIVNLRLGDAPQGTVLRWIRSRPELTGLPVFLATECRLPAEIDRALEGGCDFWVSTAGGMQQRIDAVRLIARQWELFRKAREAKS